MALAMGTDALVRCGPHPLWRYGRRGDQDIDPGLRREVRVSLPVRLAPQPRSECASCRVSDKRRGGAANAGRRPGSASRNHRASDGFGTADSRLCVSKAIIRLQ
jgi:hypothetical protein